MDYYKVVSRAFDYFYNKVHKKHFKLDLSVNKHQTKIDNFVKLIAQQFGLHGVGLNLILEYFSFAFAYWSEKNTKRPISLNWIIGKKTFNRWLDRKQGTDYYTEKFLYNNEIDIALLHQQLVEDNCDLDSNELSADEEIEKARFNGEAKLYNCLRNTTLYNHKSQHCILCVNKSTCKNMLKSLSPRVYRQRGYETT